MQLECGLKACIAKKTKRYEFPPNRRTVERIYTHDLELLIVAADLHESLGERINAHSQFRYHWEVTKRWSEESRYKKNSPETARSLVYAIADRRYGIMSWLRLHW
jgi:hypothetical protein